MNNWNLLTDTQGAQSPLDYRQYQHVGWSDTSAGGQIFFSAATLRAISQEISRKLLLAGYNIRVTDRVIMGVMNAVMRGHNPKIGSIHSRFIVPDARERDDAAAMIEQTINIVVNAVLEDYEVTANNSKLTVWTTVLGDFNAAGLRSHSQIKIKENDYMKGIFIENY